MVFPYRFILIPVPLLSFSWVSLSHQHLCFKWPTQGITTTTTGTTTGRTTRMSTRHHPLRLLLSKCWFCKHNYFRPCNRPWSTCRLLHLKRHPRHQGIGLESFSALSRLPFLKPWSQWMLMIDSSLWRRSCKWFSAASVRRCC
jgi:hypothetical protein